MHEVLENAFLRVEDLPADLDLIAEIKTLNSRGVDIPWLWNISAGPNEPKSLDQKALGFGIYNTVGALDWVEGNTRLVPRYGKNDRWVVYHLAGMHDTPVPPRAEVSIEIAFEALAEFLQTRARPTCVEWMESDDFATLRPADPAVNEHDSAPPTL